MIPLPDVSQLIQRCKALAALDLILSPEWDYRFYSFNSRWSEKELMASMRNGCGDEWWIVFHQDGWAALKGLNHECGAWSKHREKLSSALQRAMPKELNEFSVEPAFRWGETSFAYFYMAATARWTRANDFTAYSSDDAGDRELLAHLHSRPSDYASFATDYFEVEVNEQIVEDVFFNRPITASMISSLNPSTSLEEISRELYGEIGYPKPKE